MNQYCITAYDYKDKDALERRTAVREQHLERIRNLKNSGNFIKGGAILDENQQMCGSILFMQFPDRAALDIYLGNEIYLKSKVWEDMIVTPIKLVAL